jgi:hypothetical protein
MSDIRVIPTKDNGIAVVTPYNSTFVVGARRLAGKWGAVTLPSGGTERAWLFPAEVRHDVLALLREVYGEDGTVPVETTRLRVRVDLDERGLDTGAKTNVVIGGREIAHVYGRDSGARLGANVVLRSGKFSSGGSMKHPFIVIHDDTVIDLPRLPRPMAEKLIAAHPDHCRIVAEDGTELVETPIGDNVVPLRGA